MTLIYFIRELGAHTSDMESNCKEQKKITLAFQSKSVDSCIDKNGEEKDKLIELRFIDSFKFMSSSLDSLTKKPSKRWKEVIWIQGLLGAAIRPAYQKRSLSL